MKLKIAKTAKTAYLYSDGHAVILHEEDHPKAGRVEWAEVFEKLGPDCRFTGRLVFHNVNWYQTFQFAAQSAVVEASGPSLDQGSENTKRHGYAVGNLSMRPEKSGRGALHWIMIPDLISSDVTIQGKGHDETFASNTDNGFWGLVRIAKIHRAPANVETLNQPATQAA